MTTNTLETIPTPPLSFDDVYGTVIDLAQHRADLAARFPKVEDLVDRLSSDAQVVAKTACMTV